MLMPGGDLSFTFWQHAHQRESIIKTELFVFWSSAILAFSVITSLVAQVLRFTYLDYYYLHSSHKWSFVVNAVISLKPDYAISCLFCWHKPCSSGPSSVFMLLSHRSHREAYREFPPSCDIVRRWCQGLFRPKVPCTPSLHYPIAKSASTQS